MADALPAAALEHMQKSGDVALHVDVRIADGMAHARLRGQMYDRAELVAVEKLLHGLPIGDIELVESKAALSLENGESRRLELRIVVVVEIVDPDHLIAAREQRLRRVKADEARGPRDEHFHKLRHTVLPADALSSTASTCSWAPISSSLARTTTMRKLSSERLASVRALMRTGSTSAPRTNVA